MTTAQPISPTLELPAHDVVVGAPLKHGPAMPALWISFGAVAFLAASVFAFDVSWKAGIPILVAASIAIVLVVNRALCARLVVDKDADAIERMLLENEKAYAPVLTGVEAEWALLTGLVHSFARTATQPGVSRVKAKPTASGEAAQSPMEPVAARVHTNPFARAGRAAPPLSD